MLVRGFWDNLQKPVIGLSPMDGVTDAAFRYMVAKYGKPSVIMTEFTNVEGLARGASKMLVSFLYNEIERPIVAQIYGTEKESFYKCAVMLCEMGFDGIDINMGCPANKVATKGSGAGLIKTPKLARELIRITKKAIGDWANGMTMQEAGVHSGVIEEVKNMNNGKVFGRKLLPVSVKTRIGYDAVVAEEWTKNLLEELPANISMHGRTLKQMYLGRADWEVLGKAAALCKGSGVTFLGNGDVSSMSDAREKTEKFGLDGVLVGRAVLGNPWFFKGKNPTLEERFKALLEHLTYFHNLNHVSFHNIKKHLAWYTKGFEGAKELRMQLMHAQNFDQALNLIERD